MNREQQPPRHAGSPQQSPQVQRAQQPPPQQVQQPQQPPVPQRPQQRSLQPPPSAPTAQAPHPTPRQTAQHATQWAGSPHGGPQVLGAAPQRHGHVVPPPQPAASQMAPAPTTTSTATGHLNSGQNLAMSTTVEVAQPQAMVIGAPAGAPPTPGGPGPVGPSVDSVRNHRDWRIRRHREIPRLRIGSHLAPDSALDQIQLAGASFGFRMGRTQTGYPITLTLFRPEPRVACVIGGVWAAKLIAFRALRFGARVVVSTVQPAGWADLGRMATGRADRVIVLAPNMASDVMASAATPVLRLHDVPHPPAQEKTSPWRTELTVLRRLTPDRTAVLSNADIVLSQRLAPNEVSVAMSTLGLPSELAHQLQRLNDNMMMMLNGSHANLVWVDPTESERQRVGNQTRY